MIQRDPGLTGRSTFAILGRKDGENMPKTIGIIDADLLDNGTRHPNLALMKISGYQKELGNDVTLLEDYYSIPKYDEVYLSRVFDFTNVPIDPICTLEAPAFSG
jgi:hypothetical protein